jgi:hypothetical protein
MERWRARQTNLFEKSPQAAELPEPQRQKALLLLGSLLTEALAMQNADENLEQSREGGHDKDHC